MGPIPCMSRAAASESGVGGGNSAGEVELAAACLMLGNSVLPDAGT